MATSGAAAIDRDPDGTERPQELPAVVLKLTRLTGGNRVARRETMPTG